MARYEAWNARGKGACGTLSRVTRGDDQRRYLYATARRDGMLSRFAWQYAVDTVEAEARNIRAEWVPDYDMDGTAGWDCVDNPSPLNRCEHEHGGRHIKRGSRSKCECAPGYGHRHGTLYSNCHYAPVREFSACAIVQHSRTEACDRACQRGEYWTSGTCEVLEALHGIEESLDNRERAAYRRDVEAELLRQSLGEIHEREAAEMERTRERGRAYVGRGI